MNYFYICINVNQDLFIENTNKWERWTPIPIFPIDSSKSFNLLLFNSLKIHDTNNLSNRFWHIFSYLVNIILKILELFLVGLIFVLMDNLLLMTRYNCHKIVINHSFWIKNNGFHKKLHSTMTDKIFTNRFLKLEVFIKVK